MGFSGQEVNQAGCWGSDPWKGQEGSRTGHSEELDHYVVSLAVTDSPTGSSENEILQSAPHVRGWKTGPFDLWLVTDHRLPQKVDRTWSKADSSLPKAALGRC